jgi:DNA polymerase-3 subunit gamma/tau
VDVQEIDAASNSHVEDVRELREMILYRPQAWRYRITILDEVHMLSRQAFNALLKTLEEPPSHALFILATTDVHRLPPTILSRCQRYDFRRISPGLLAHHLEQVCAAEGFSLEAASLDLLAREADGSTRDALSLLDQVMSYGDTHPGHQQVVESLGLVDRTLVKGCAQAILDNNAPALLDIVSQVYQAGGEMQAFYGHLQEHFRNLAAALAAPADQGLFGLTGQEMQEFKTQAAGLSPETIHEIFSHLAQGEEMFRRAQHPRLVMEMLLLKLTQITPVVSLDAIIAMLEQSPGALLQASPELLRTLKLSQDNEAAADKETALVPPPAALAEASPPLLTRSEPGRQTVKEARPADPQELINKLADYVARSEIMLAYYLRQGQAKWLDEALVVEIGPDLMNPSYDNEEKQIILNRLARELWEGEPPLIKFIYNEKAKAWPASDSSQLSLREACQDPAVRAAMDILEARPIEIRPLSAPLDSAIKKPASLPLDNEDGPNLTEEDDEDKNDVT